VKLFKFPNFENSSYNKFNGHSSHVTNVRFTNKDKFLISIGGNDKSIFQWKVKSHKEEENNLSYEENSDSEFERDYEIE